MIESRENKHIKELKALKQKKYREQTGLFCIEGEKFIDEIPEDWRIERFYISESYHGAVLKMEERAPVFVIKNSLFAAISDTEAPQGRLAVCRKRVYDLNCLLNAENPMFVLAEELSDPGNLGTIIRTAHAAGFTGVLLSKGSAELYSSKVLRSAAGSAFHIPVIENLDLFEIITTLRQRGITTAAAHLSGKPLYTLDMTKPAAILIGNEARGLSDALAQKADHLIRIPMPGGAESLNASVACGIFIYEAVRQKYYLEEKTCKTLS